MKKYTNTISNQHGIHVTLDELIALQPLARGVELAHKHKARSQLLGGHLSNLRGRGMEFDEIRNYQAGDDIRHMEWRVTARTGQAHVKLFREEREQPTFLIVDFNPSMYFGTKTALKSVVASKIAALIAWSAEQHGDRVGGVIYSGETHVELKPRARRLGVLPLLNALSDFSQRLPSEKITPLSETLIKLRRISKPGALTFLVSDFSNIDDEAEKHLAYLSKHQQLLAFIIRDPLEINPPPADSYAITNGKETMLLDTRNENIRKQYSDYFSQRFENISHLFHKFNIPCIAIQTDDDLLLSLRNKI